MCLYVDYENPRAVEIYEKLKTDKKITAAKVYAVTSNHILQFPRRLAFDLTPSIRLRSGDIRSPYRSTVLAVSEDGWVTSNRKKYLNHLNENLGIIDYGIHVYATENEFEVNQNRDNFLYPAFAVKAECHLEDFVGIGFTTSTNVKAEFRSLSLVFDKIKLDLNELQSKAMECYEAERVNNHDLPKRTDLLYRIQGVNDVPTY